MNRLQKRSFRAIIGSNCFVRLGDSLSDPKTILTWLLSALGAPAFAVAMLVPIRESGSMLPQLFLSGFIQRFRRRKPLYLVGLFCQFLSIAAVGLAAFLLEPKPLAWVALVALACFATARALCSITAKDVLGRAVPKGSRGKLAGIATMLSGVFATIVAIIFLASRDQNDPKLLASLVLIASLMWLLASASFSFVHEVSEESNSSEEKKTSSMWSRLKLLQTDSLFRRFVITRSLLLGTALASPVIVVLAHRQGGSDHALISFIVAGALASALSSVTWGHFADKASHLAMAVGGLVATLTGLAAVLVYFYLPALAAHPITWPGLFFIFSVGYMGVRLGRSTWVVDAAEGDLRTNYVAASNTIVASLIILLGLIAAPLQTYSPILALLFYSLCCLGGSWLAAGLKIPEPAQE